MFRSIYKKIISAVCISVVAGSVLLQKQSITAYAWNDNSTAYDQAITKDADGNWVVTFYDKEHTSNIYYSTEGYKLTINGADYTQQLFFNDRYTDSIVDANGMVTTQKVIPAADVKAAFYAIDSTGALYNQYEAGDYSNIRLDGLMSITHEVGGVKYNSMSRKFGDAVYDTTFPDGYLLSLIGPDGLFDLSNSTELLNMIKAYGWSASDIKDLLNTHTNKNLNNSVYALLEKLAKEEAEEKEKKKEDEPGTGTNVHKVDHMSGRNYPIYKTYNTSGEFNLGEGIPSGESFTNGVKADVWYGVYGWTKVEGDYIIPVTVTFSGTWYRYTLEFNGYDEDGDPEYSVEKEDYDWTNSYTFYLTRSYLYYYLSYIDTSILDNLVVQNGCFDSDKTYTNGISVEAEGVHDDEDVTYTTYYSSNEELHTIKPSAAPEVDMGYCSPSSFNPTSYEGLAEEELGGVTVWNDYLSINGKTYIDNQKVTGSDQENNKKAVAPTPKDIEEADYEAVQYENTQGVTIPKEIRNASYTTTLNATYKSLLPPMGLSKSWSSKGDNCILSGYENNEPIIVHTPVISPVKIITDHTAGDDTQLVNQNSKGGAEWEDLDEKYWLRLDSTYSFQFQPYKWLQDILDLSSDELIQQFGRDLQGYSEGHATTKFDKYVKWKRVKFPFDVCVNGVFYEVGEDGAYTDSVTGETYTYRDAETGIQYTKWIYLPISSDTAVDFYIPSWADETTTTFQDRQGYYKIKYEVAAYNVIDQFMTNNEEKKEELENSKWNPNEGTPGGEDTSRYVATYEIGVNLSGWIYDFQVVGTTNASIYDKETAEENKGQFYNQKYSFALNKEEKKSGVYNRLGTKDIRYALDGITTDNWNKNNTIALSKGRSTSFSDMGGLWKGQYFTFTVKTIANLYDATDYLEILPDFRYVDNDGNIYRNDNASEDDDVQFYYSLSTGEKFYKFGSSAGDGVRLSTYLGDDMFEGSYYDGRTESHGNDDLTYSANTYYAHITNPVHYYMNNTVNNYNLEKIKLNGTLRLLTGNLEQLNGNLGNGPTSLKTLSELYAYNGSDADVSGITELDNQLHSSMQTWFGQYYIPTEFYVVRKEVLEDYIVPTSSGSLDRNGDGEVDLRDYVDAHYTDESHSKIEGGVATDAPIFDTEGYVVINFDIKSYDNSEPHLKYNGGNSNGGMWSTEKGGPIPDIETGGIPDITIPGEPGDVAIIELKHSTQDKYSVRILFID